MYDKRPAWCLAAAAPHGGSLRDVVAAAMTELPTDEAGARRPAQRHAGQRRRRGADRPARRRRAPLDGAAVDGHRPRARLRAGWPSSSCRARSRWPSSRPSCSPASGAAHVFDDEYISSGGQLHELIAGHDRFVADLRPLVDPDAFACHPYDVCTAMLLEEAGGVVTDPRGAPLDVPLDTTIAGRVGRATRTRRSRRRIGPILAELVDDLDAPVARPDASTCSGGVADYSGALRARRSRRASRRPSSPSPTTRSSSGRCASPSTRWRRSRALPYPEMRAALASFPKLDALRARRRARCSSATA